MCTMRRSWCSVDRGAMTDAKTFTPRTPLTMPPLSSVTQLAVAVSLILGSALEAVPQYIEYLRAGDLEREQQIAWGLAHQGFYRAEWAAGMVGSFLLLLGFLGLWQLTRWYTPKLTLVGAIVLTWGMTGQIFSEVATFITVVAADTLGASGAERLIAQGYLKDPAMIAVILVPVIAGMFIGVLILAVACWRSALPKAPVVALALWPLWDFFGPGPVGPFSGDLLLLFAGVWLGVAVAGLPRQRWLGDID